MKPSEELLVLERNLTLMYVSVGSYLVLLTVGVMLV